MKTDVIIIGAGPAGLMLGHLLAQAGVDALIIERQTSEHILSRIRAGILEQCTVGIMSQLDLDDRLQKEGLPHDYVSLTNRDQLIRIPVKELTGKHVIAYGQTEIMRDLMDAAPARGVQTIYEAADVALHDIHSPKPYITYQKGGHQYRINGQFIVGCDGQHGPSRKSVPKGGGPALELTYPFGWLGILSDVPPCADEVVYARHDNGFALASMRSATRSRYYLQVPADEHVDNWPDDRIWDELKVRLGPNFARGITAGKAIEKSIAPLRSFISETMRFGNLFLAGDAAHIVPPTGAKGLNLAASDVAYLAPGLIAHFKQKDSALLKTYEAKALSRVWKSSRFAWCLTNLMHNFPENGEFNRRMQIAELDYIGSSQAAQKSIAENYTGLPL